MGVLDRIRSATKLHPKWCVPLMSVSLAYRTAREFTQHNAPYDSSDDETFWVRRWGARLTLGGGDERSLYWNAALFVRINLPFGVWFGVRLGEKRLFQCGIGYKLSGVLGANFRFQTDDSSAAGVTGPNYGQARGWWDGTH